MEINGHRFDRVEFAGSLGDLGTLIPLSVALIVVTGLSPSSVLLMVGIFYIATGFWFKLPIPVQPLKLVSAIAIAFPGKVTLPIMGASGIIFGIILILLAGSGIIDRLTKFFTKPIIRGIQIGLGFILMSKGIKFITGHDLFIRTDGLGAGIHSFPFVNTFIGLIAFITALCLLNSKKFPASLVIVLGGILAGALLGDFSDINLTLGPSSMALTLPSIGNLYDALILLVIPQIPLTIGNAVMGTKDTCGVLFGETRDISRATHKGFAMSMGLMNILTGLFCAMPMCHGSGGLAAHHRFGARTGGSNIMIGSCFIILALGFGTMAVTLLSAIPAAVMGVLLIFAGIELVLLIRDVTKKNDLFVTVLIAGIGLATSNMTFAFIAGIIVMKIIQWKKINL